MGVQKRLTSGGKRYCALCKHFEGQVLENGEKVTLHRIPGGKSAAEVKRRKAWIRGLRLHRPDMKTNENTRICILHFEDHNYMKGESIPKYFNLAKTTTSTARRPLKRIFQNENDVDSDCQLDNQGNDSTTTQIQEQSEPSVYFIDDINSCETIEVDLVTNQSDSHQCYTVTSEHGYAISGQQTSNSKETETQTEATPDITMKPEDIYNDDERTRFYTGFPNYATFLLIFQTLLQHGADKLTYWEGQKRSLGAENREYNYDEIGKPGRKRRLRPIDEFYMVCLRLRLGLLQDHLKDIFKVSVMTVSRVMNTWINFLYDHMKSLIPWPTKEEIMANLPSHFIELPQVRIVIDATEFFCEKPNSLTAQNLTWSEYKHHNTFKVLIGVTPNGLVTFISRVWGGHTSDRHIVQKDGHLLIPKLESGDIILADKGFTVADLLPPHIGLNMPPFITKAKQMSKHEFFKTQKVASARIVVEMKMEQIKNFRILQTVLPLSEAHLAEQIIVICTAITNLYEPLLK